MYKDLIDRLDGYFVGTTAVMEGQAYLITDDDDVELDTNCQIEIMTVDEKGTHYNEITYEELLYERTKFEGWPLFAGFHARVKRG
ncbi:hypothetical protein [Paraliobacillus zengyii]|uniref:hypothetical protein n=1 Tax=Paraliobacillus zengyii TaxID=2213194 RepID=UPI000DD3196D|nr:hypothetical protein [Paraliobacillus zengyii]